MKFTAKIVPLRPNERTNIEQRLSTLPYATGRLLLDRIARALAYAEINNQNEKDDLVNLLNNNGVTFRRTQNVNGVIAFNLLYNAPQQQQQLAVAHPQNNNQQQIDHIVNTLNTLLTNQQAMNIAIGNIVVGNRRPHFLRFVAEI